MPAWKSLGLGLCLFAAVYAAGDDAAPVNGCRSVPPLPELVTGKRIYVCGVLDADPLRIKKPDAGNDACHELAL